MGEAGDGSGIGGFICADELGIRATGSHAAAKRDDVGDWSGRAEVGIRLGIISIKIPGHGDNGCWSHCLRTQMEGVAETLAWHFWATGTVSSPVSLNDLIGGDCCRVAG